MEMNMREENKIIVISIISLKKFYNGTLKRTLETYINNIELKEESDQRTINLTKEQLQILDTHCNERERSNLISAIITSYIKKLQSKNYKLKIACSTSEFIRNAITDWILYDLNTENNYSETLKNWLTIINGKKKEKKEIKTKPLLINRKAGKKDFNPKFPLGIKPKIILPLFKSDIYANRLISHLAEIQGQFLTFKELREKIGCVDSTITNRAITINEQYPKLIIRQKDNKEYSKFGINQNVLEEVLKNV